MKTARTTIEIDRELLKKAKQQAIDEDKTLKELIAEALIKQLREQPRKKMVKTRKYIFKAYNMGKIKGNLTREEIYDWL